MRDRVTHRADKSPRNRRQRIAPEREPVGPFEALFTHGQPAVTRALLRAGFPILRVAMRRRFEIRAESASHSHAMIAAGIDRLEREVSPSGYLVGDSFTVADLTAAALLYPVARPPEFPYALVDDDELPRSWREFLDSLRQRPGGRWVAEIYRRHRGVSAELTPAEAGTLRPELTPN